MLSQTRMAPLVSRLLAEYPRVQIQYELTNRRVDVIEESFDVALRVLLLIGSPALIERFGRPHSPVDLMRFESLSLSFAPANRHGS